MSEPSTADRTERVALAADTDSLDRAAQLTQQKIDKIARLRKYISVRGVFLRMFRDFLAGMLFCTAYLAIEYYQAANEQPTQTKVSQQNNRDRTGTSR